MDSLEFKSIIAGVLFGIWPLFINRSGLTGNVASFVFASVVLLSVSPFAVSNLSQIGNSYWIWAVAAGIVGAAGLLLFNNVLSKATPQSVGILVVLMILIQTVVPAVYQVIMNGEISMTKLAGFVLAVVASFLLVK